MVDEAINFETLFLTIPSLPSKSGKLKSCRSLQYISSIKRDFWRCISPWIEGKSFDRFNMTEWIWPKNLNMTEKITPTNINLLNMTEIVWQRLSWAVEYDRNQKIKFVVLMNLPFMLVVLMNLFNFYYYFGHIQPVKFIVLMNLRHFKISVIFMGISVMFNRSCSSV